MRVADTIRQQAANLPDGKSVGIVLAMRGPRHLLVFEQVSAPNRVQPWRSVNADSPSTFISERRSFSVISAAVRETIGEISFPAVRHSCNLAFHG